MFNWFTYDCVFGLWCVNAAQVWIWRGKGYSCVCHVCNGRGADVCPEGSFSQVIIIIKWAFSSALLVQRILSLSIWQSQMFIRKSWSFLLLILHNNNLKPNLSCKDTPYLSYYLVSVVEKLLLTVPKLYYILLYVWYANS